MDSPQSAPAVGYVHLETDASLNNERTEFAPDGELLRFAGGGLVLRTIAMRPILSEPLPLGFVHSAMEAEGLALLAGIERARGLGATTVRARTDSAHMVEVLEGRGAFSEPYLESVADRLRAAISALPGGFRVIWTHSHHARTRGDGVPSADYLARQAAGLETRGELRRRSRHRH